MMTYETLAAEAAELVTSPSLHAEDDGAFWARYSLNMAMGSSVAVEVGTVSRTWAHHKALALRAGAGY